MNRDTRIRGLLDEYTEASEILTEIVTSLDDESVTVETINGQIKFHDHENDRWWNGAGAEVYRLEHSDVFLYNAHPRHQCINERCTIHNRSDHPLRKFPQTFDRIMHRTCPHGFDHPDPDEPGYELWMLEHTCDGCCGT